MEYIVVSAAKTLKGKPEKEVAQKLEEQVRVRLSEGYEPVGGVAVDNYGLYQAMVKL